MLHDPTSIYRLFESELEEWEKSGDVDCLGAWGNYLSWLEERGLNRHNSYKEAIQKCLKYFASEPDFFGDIRLAKIYIKAVRNYDRGRFNVQWIGLVRPARLGFWLCVHIVTVYYSVHVSYPCKLSSNNVY